MKWEPRTYISVRPDLKGFHNTVKRDLRAMAPSMVTIGREWGMALQRGIKEKLNPIEVRLDTGSVAAQLVTLNRAVDRLDGRVVNIQLNADVGAASARLVEFEQSLSRLDGRAINIAINVDMGGAVAELSALEQILARLDGRNVNVQVNADVAAAISQLLAANAAASALDGRRANVGVNVDIGGALAAIASVRTALIALGAAAAPALVGVGAGVVGLAAPLAAAGAGFGAFGAVAIPAISNVGKALQQQKQASQQAGAASGQAAQRASAEAGARQQLASAIRNAAYAHQQALDQVRTAEQQYQQALQSEAEAQRTVAAARQQAQRSIQDLKNQVIDAGYAVEEARLGVEQARASWDQMAAAAKAAGDKVAAAQSALAKAQAEQQKLLATPGATDAAKKQAQANVDAAKQAVKSAADQKKAADLAARQAELNYRQSVQRLKEQQLQLKRLQQDEKAASKAGVEGSDAVRSARQRLAQANQQVSNSELALKRAREGVTRADQQSADQIASARRALAQATSQAASSTGALGKQMIQLTPLEQQLATAWKGLTDAFKDWQKSLQPDVIPVLIKGISLLKSSLPLLTPLVHGASTAIGQLLTEVTAAAKSPFWTQFSEFLGQGVGPAIVGFGHVLGSLVTGLAGLVQAFAPIGVAFLSILNVVAQRFAAFATGLASNPAFQAFTRQFQSLAPLMAQTFTSLGRLLGSLFAALAPALGPALGLINTLANALGNVLRQVGPSIASVLSTLGQGLSAVIVALAPVVAQLVQALAPLLNQLINGLRPILLALVPVLGQVIAGLAPVISALLSGLQPAIQSLVPVVSLLVGALARILGAVAPVLPLLGQFIAQLVAGLMPILTPIVNAIALMAQQIAGALIQALRQSAPALLQMVLAVASLLPELIPLVPLWAQLLTTIAPLLPVIVQLAAVILQALLPVLRIAIQIVVWYWTTIASLLIPVFKLMVQVITWVAGILTPIIQGIGWLIRGIGTAATFLWGVIKIAFEGIVFAAKILAAVFFVVVLAPFLIAFNLIKIGVMALWKNAFVPAWNGISWAAQKAWQLLQPLFSLLRGGLRLVGQVMSWLWKNIVVPTWNGIKTAISTAWGYIKTIFNVIVTVIRVTLGPIFKWFRDNVIRPVWNTVGSIIRGVWNTTIKPTFDVLKGAVGKVRDAFKVAVDGIAKIWDGLKSVTKKPVQFVVDTVYNKGIRSAWNTIAGLVKLPPLPELHFAAGGVVPAGAYGVLPGYSPGQDSMLAAVSPGEAWIRPDATRALGPSFIYGLNSAAASGGTAAAGRFLSDWQGPAFAVGGIVGKIGDVVKGAKNLVVHGASDLLAKGASFAARKILDPIIKQISGMTPDSPWAKAMALLPKQMVDGFLGWLTKVVDPKIGGDATGVVAAAKKYIGQGDDRGPNNNQFSRAFGMPGAPWCAMFVSTAIKDAHAQKKYPGYPSAAVASYVGAMKHVGLGEGRAGDLAAYRGTGHINIIESKAGGGYMTIGGNQNAVVQRGVRGGQSSILRPSFAVGGIVSDAYQIFRREAPRNADRHEDQTPLVQLMSGLNQSAARSVAASIIRNKLEITNAGLFDSGGYLPPGASLVVNNTGRPEPVLTDVQLRALVDGSSGGGTVEYHAHFDGMTKAAYASQVRTGIQAEMVLAAQRDRTGRRK